MDTLKRDIERSLFFALLVSRELLGSTSHIMFYLSQVMRLESWKQRWTGLGGQTVRSFSVDTESELDERDLRICLQDHINTTTPNSPEV